MTSLEQKLELRFQQIESELENHGKIITSQHQIITSQNQIITTLRSKLVTAESKLVTLESKLVTAESRLATAETELAQLKERFDLLDRNLGVIAPFIRAMLCDQASILTDPDYFTELRDTEDESSFTPAVDILKAQPEFDSWSAKYDSQVKGLTIGFGQRLSAFYQNVTSNTPRKFERRFKYWLDAESVIVENVLRLFKATI